MSENIIHDCPFCGWGAVAQKGQSAFIDCIITCTGCHASGPTFDDGETYEENLQNATQAWNTRVAYADSKAAWSIEKLLESLVLQHATECDDHEVRETALEVARKFRIDYEASQAPTNRERMLGEALGQVLVKAGMLRDDVSLTGPELLTAAETFCLADQSLLGPAVDGRELAAMVLAFFARDRGTDRQEKMLDGLAEVARRFIIDTEEARAAAAS